MPSVNDLYVQSLLHPIVDGEEKSPTIVSILLILLTEVILAHELPPPGPGDEVNCVVCQESLKHSDKKELLVLSCGHAQHRDCVEEWLLGKREHLYPVYAQHVDTDQPVQVVQPPENVEPIWDKLDIRRNCPICRNVIIPKANEGYNMSQYEDGIAPEEAQHILDYFTDPKRGERRIARLNDEATIGIQLQAAHDYARKLYTGEFWAKEWQKETEACFAQGDRLMEQRDANDSDYEPPKRKKVKRSRSRRDKTNHVNQRSSDHSPDQSKKRPAPVYIDLTQDSDDDGEMCDVEHTPLTASARTSNGYKSSNGEYVFKEHPVMRPIDYMMARKRKRLIETGQILRVL